MVAYLLEIIELPTTMTGVMGCERRDGLMVPAKTLISPCTSPQASIRRQWKTESLRLVPADSSSSNRLRQEGLTSEAVALDVEHRRLTNG